MAKPTEPKPRIPAGTSVTWKARYDADPVNEGRVLSFQPAWTRDPVTGIIGCFDIYVVDVPLTPGGKLRKTPKTMRPYASVLESQNPDALK